MAKHVTLSMTDTDADARQALRLFGPDPQNWVPDREGIDHNVTIVGGGQSGCTLVCVAASRDRQGLAH